MSRYGIKEVKENTLWINVIRTRDKISHSYFSLTTEPLFHTIKDLPELLKSLQKIKKELF